MIRRLLFLNGLAILSVVLFHTTSWGMTAMFAWTPRYMSVSEPVFDQTGSLPYYWIRIAEQIVAIAIPAFLFVSGYFIAFITGRRDNMSWKQIWGRIKALLIPYTIWSLLIWIGWLILLGEFHSPKYYVVNFLTGSTTITYYYIPLLIQFYILSPIIIPIAKKNWKCLLIVTGLFQLLLQVSIMLELMYGYEEIPKVMGWLAYMPKWLFITRLFWLVLGMVVGFHIAQFKRFLARFKYLFPLIVIVAIPLGIFEWEAIFHFSGREWLNMRETILDSVYAIALIFTLLAFNNVSLPWNKQISDIGAKSFGIYLIHYTAMEYVAKGIYHFYPQLLRIQILFQGMILFVGLGLPLLLMHLVEKNNFRKYYSYLYG